MQPKRVHGFTLVELLVVFAIMGVFLAVVPSAMGKLRDAVAYRQTVQEISTLLRQARQQARLQGLQTAVQFYTETRRFGLQGQVLSDLDESLGMAVEVADITHTADGGRAIWFSPEGGSTGGSVAIVRTGTSPAVGVRLRVDWLSGLITQEALE